LIYISKENYVHVTVWVTLHSYGQYTIYVELFFWYLEYFFLILAIVFLALKRYLVHFFHALENERAESKDTHRAGFSF
jgi:hypothetical protein